MKSKSTAAVLALFLGGIGGHKFYLGRTGAGLLYLLFCWTFIPAFVALIDVVVLLCMGDQEFDSKYNLHAMLAKNSQPQQIAQSVVVNIPGMGAPMSGVAPQSAIDQLTKLNELRIAGVLSDAEFNAQKQKLLAASNA